MLTLLIIYLIDSDLITASFELNLTETVDILQRRVIILNNKAGKWWSFRMNASMSRSNSPNIIKVVVPTLVL